MKKRFWLTLFCVVVAAVFKIEATDNKSPLLQMVETERDFGRQCLIIGQKEATFQAMADDGILFRPGPINAKRVLAAAQPIPFILKFDPEFADMAASGDFGYTSGPWEFQNSLPLQPPFEYGYYATIWKKQADGQFKVAVALAVDIGDAMPRDYSYTLSYPRDADRERDFTLVPDIEAQRATLLQADNRHAKAWQQNPAPETYLSFLASKARLYRKDRFPSSEPTVIREMIREMGLYSWQPMQSDVARSGDLGYSYGSYTSVIDGKEIQGHYLKFWKREGNEPWRVVIDLHKPLGSF